MTGRRIRSLDWLNEGKPDDADNRGFGIAAGVTVEDLARAWASLDGKQDAFDAGRNKSVFDDETGHYAGYCFEVREIVTRATKYAQEKAP